MIDQEIDLVRRARPLDLPDNPQVKADRDKLKAEWAPKSDTHAKAREYLLKTWPAVATIPDFKDSLPLIGANVEECMKNNDYYTLRKLQTIFSGAVRSRCS